MSAPAQLQYTDRYGALHMQPGTCDGPCEGIGFWPKRVHAPGLRCKHGDATNGYLCDGTHFVTCADCDGTGTKPRLVPR